MWYNVMIVGLETSGSRYLGGERSKAGAQTPVDPSEGADDNHAPHDLIERPQDKRTTTKHSTPQAEGRPQEIAGA